jgi:hypothetical protein
VKSRGSFLPATHHMLSYIRLLCYLTEALDNGNSLM